MPAEAFTFLVDADFALPPGLLAELTAGRSRGMLHHMRAAWQREGARHAMVVPAYERKSAVCPNAARVGECAPSLAHLQSGDACYMEGAYDAPVTRAELRRMYVEDGAVVGFYDDKVRGCCLARMCQSGGLRVPGCVASREGGLCGLVCACG